MKKPGVLSFVVFLIFSGSIFYMLSYPTRHHIADPTIYPWLRAGFYVLLYGGFLYFVFRSTSTVNYSLDIFSCLFLKIYLGFKVVFFCFLLDKDLPFYIKALDSKEVSLGLSLFVLVFTIALFIINYDRYKKLFR
jgi:hypothetical protein